MGRGASVPSHQKNGRRTSVCSRHGADPAFAEPPSQRFGVAGGRSTESVSAKELPGAGVQRVFDGQTISLRSTLVAARQLILFSLDSMGLAVAFRLGGTSIVSTVESHLLLVKRLRLAI